MEFSDPTEPAAKRLRHTATVMAVLKRAGAIERDDLLRPMGEVYDALIAAADGHPIDDPDAGPRFAGLLVEIAANALVRLINLEPAELRDIFAAHDGRDLPAENRATARREFAHEVAAKLEATLPDGRAAAALVLEHLAETTE